MMTSGRFPEVFGQRFQANVVNNDQVGFEIAHYPFSTLVAARHVIGLTCTTKATYKFSGFKTARFGRKMGAGANYLPFYFAFLAFFGIFSFGSYCSPVVSIEAEAPKKIIPKNLP
jgi:hypothetical protein